MRWHDSCRSISARFLRDLLTRAQPGEAPPFLGVRIKGARIAEDVDLVDAKLIRLLEIVGNRIEGKIDLSDARTDSLIRLEDSLLNGDFNAESLHSERRHRRRWRAANRRAKST